VSLGNVKWIYESVDVIALRDMHSDYGGGKGTKEMSQEGPIRPTVDAIEAAMYGAAPLPVPAQLVSGFSELFVIDGLSLAGIGAIARAKESGYLVVDRMTPAGRATWSGWWGWCWASGIPAVRACPQHEGWEIELDLSTVGPSARLPDGVFSELWNLLCAQARGPVQGGDRGLQVYGVPTDQVAAIARDMTLAARAVDGGT